jgi:hypothetical protein
LVAGDGGAIDGPTRHSSTDGLSGEPLRIATAEGLSNAVLVVAAAIALTGLVALNLSPRPDTAAESHARADYRSLHATVDHPAPDPD